MRVLVAEEHTTVVVLDDPREKVLTKIRAVKQNLVLLVSSTSKSIPSFWKLSEVLPIWEAESKRKLSSFFILLIFIYLLNSI